MVAIVVVTYNRLNLLKEEIISLRNQTYSERQIIVVNNGSTDGTLEWLKEQNDIITITQENCGGAGGFFTGIKYAVENGYDYCWVMDDDVDCSPNALEELVKSYNAKPNIGFVCSKVYGLDGNAMNTPIVDDRGGVNGYADYSDMVDEGMIKVKMATFVSVFFSSSIVKELGLPYKEYFIWGDDYEYTSRISSRYDSYMSCRSHVLHKRIIQGVLSFEDEVNTSRLRNYFYKFRNEGYNSMMYDGVSRYVTIVRLIKYAVRLSLKLNLKKAGILIRSALSLLSFSPVKVIPEVK